MSERINMKWIHKCHLREKEFKAESSRGVAFVGKTLLFERYMVTIIIYLKILRNVPLQDSRHTNVC